MKNFFLKKDKYSKSRGGYSRFLNIYCHHCGKEVLIYQKDGPGELKRIYLDRIFSPMPLVNLQNLQIKKIQDLICKKCGRVLAIPYIYQNERRKAYRLFVGAVIKRVTKIKM